jgi:hypothetical protein
VNGWIGFSPEKSRVVALDTPVLVDTLRTDRRLDASVIGRSG